VIPIGAALLVIDVQKGFDAPGWGGRNNPGAEGTVARLLHAWRTAGWPVLHAQHVSREDGSALAPGQPGVERTCSRDSSGTAVTKLSNTG